MEHIGSGMNRILKVYEQNIFKLSEHFIEVAFPFAEDYEEVSPHVTPHVTTEVTTEVKKIIFTLSGEMSRSELREKLDLKNDEHFRKQYLLPALNGEFIEMTQSDSPKSPTQKYRLTAKGVEVKKQLVGGVKYD